MKCKYKKFLKAAYINYDEDYCSYGSGTFTKPAVTTPIIVITGTTAIIACAISGVTIYYTLDGSTPTSSSTLYTGPITLTLSCTIKAIAVKPGMSDSEVASESYVHITYLTQWKIVGNSEVHSVGNLTSWKVTGNSVVNNNTILSCGDLGQDGKYHVKISNGVTIFDIPLDAPLRKVSSIADNITFTNGTATVTRELGIIADLSQLRWTAQSTRGSEKRWLSNAQSQFAAYTNDTYADILCAKYQTRQANGIYEREKGIAININKVIQIYDSNYIQSEDETAFVASLDGVELIAKLATPTTETIQVSPFPVSPTDTYTSANVVPYSTFEHTENKEIWSCGEYNATDGKYHILVQPQGGSIADIALTEPLRKVNNTADTLEYPTETSGKALLTIRVEESGGELSPLDTPTTELVDVPQIAEADSYTCVISQGGKAVSWSGFETE